MAEHVDEIGQDSEPVTGDEAADLLYVAWTIIANAGGGDWTTQTDEWVAAAVRWRDRFHALIGSAEEADRG